MVRITLMITSIIIIIFGWGIKDLFVAIIGSVIFLCILSLNLYKTFLLAKKYKDQIVDEKNESPSDNGFVSKLEGIVEGAISLSSLIGMVVLHDKGDLYFYPPLIIWTGTILIYFLSGVVIQEITKIPMRFGYGGWAIKHRKRN